LLLHGLGLHILLLKLLLVVDHGNAPLRLPLLTTLLWLAVAVAVLLMLQHQEAAAVARVDLELELLCRLLLVLHTPSQ
jgi:hypothetical protein